MHDDHLENAVVRAQELIDRLETIDDEQLRAEIVELLRHVDTMHREGLGRLCAMLRAAGHERFLDLASEDEAVALLLGLYDLDPRPQPIPAPPSSRPRLFHIEGLEEAFDPNRHDDDPEP